jgi:hypothetical protein
MDSDLEQMTPEQLRSEVKKLRAGIRDHRDRSGHDLCWHVPDLWDLLPDKREAQPEVPPTEEFLLHCKLYRASLDGVPEPDLTEEDLLVRTITHPAGYIVDLFAMLSVRGSEDPDVWEVEWENDFRIPAPHAAHAAFPTAREAVRFFLKQRNRLELGIDHEIRLSKARNQ